MRFVAFMLILTTSLNTWANGKAYLDLEDGQIVSVFNKPGMNWKNCATDTSCRPVGWPDRGAEVEVISDKPKRMMVEDPYTGKKQPEDYLKIKYTYQREANGKSFTQSGEGWIDAAYVSYSKRKSVFGTDSAPMTEVCPPRPKSVAPQQTVTDLATAFVNNSVTNTADLLREHVGACVIDPRNPPNSFHGENPFDTYVLPHLSKRGLPKITREDGKPMTRQDLIDIDALARTMYAEMARCYKHGLQYPMAVAKIAVNRANSSNRHREFIKGPHNQTKGPLAKVVTTPSQFNLWMKTLDGKKNGTLSHALCPPSEKTRPFWTGSTPGKDEQAIWDNTLRIATEAVLFPKKFQSRTAQLQQFHYTSGMNGFYGMRQVYPWIAERKVSRNACVQVWDEGVK